MKEFVFCLTHLFTIAWRLDRRRLIIGAGLLLLGAVATPVVALGVGAFVDALVAGDGDSAARWGIVLGVAVTGELMLGHFAHLYYFELAEAVEEQFNRDLLQLVNGGYHLDRADDPAFADRVDLLRQDVLQMRSTVQQGLQLTATVVQVVLTGVVLSQVSPWLLLLVGVAAIPVLAGKKAEAGFQATREAQAATTRGIRHFRRLATTPASQKEIRLSGGGDHVLGLQHTLLTRYGTAMAAADRRYALLRSAGQMAFAVAYVAAVVWVFLLARDGTVSVGDAVLTVVLATQLSTQMAAGIEMVGSVQRASAGLDRFMRARAELAAEQHSADLVLDPTGRPGDGIWLDGVTFRYPGSGEDVLRGIDLHIPGGTSVALVGENGAGKSTLLKLLTGLYQPTSGQVSIMTADGEVVTPENCRDRIASLFQDFARVELSVRDSIGIGQLGDVDDDAAVLAAADTAGAGRIARDVGLDGFLGRGYTDGRDLSGGQWQAVGFARTLMRTDPLLLVLDEPASALDAYAEQRIVDAYQTVAEDLARTNGGVTIFVTHRLSTVRLADRIVVMDGGRISASGTHDELLADGGLYAELWGLQAESYRR